MPSVEAFGIVAVRERRSQMPYQPADSVRLQCMLDLIDKKDCAIWHNGLLDRKSHEPARAKTSRPNGHGTIMQRQSPEVNRHGRGVNRWPKLLLRYCPKFTSALRSRVGGFHVVSQIARRDRIPCRPVSVGENTFSTWSPRQPRQRRAPAPG